MTIDTLVAGLFGVTFVAAFVFAITSKKYTDEELQDDNASKPTYDRNDKNGRRDNR
ncbi:hypothetical protein [Flavimaricola marinus]|uniref:Uncharacterized protein n=1 Tax=Flavimaricola marinus TaxID=1819565 RepID=A0A238LKN5_9RHOB|nr:hypothetical protein [Flavimaricola marinus]SMY10277.1 hypothetical protein LOM8899_04452 [Flavimaricola marinus]